MSKQEKWECSHDKCTRENPYCKSILGGKAEGTFTFIQLKDDNRQVCQFVAQAYADHYRALAQESQADEDQDDLEITPKGISIGLKKRVHGQDPAVKSLATMVFEELYVKPQVRADEEIMAEFGLRQDDVRKNNGIIVGPTGSGKTYMLSSVAKLLDVPFYVYRNTASLTKAGYVGEDVEEIIKQVLIHTKNWLQERGEELSEEEVAARINSGEQPAMCGLDEFDKLDKKTGHHSDVGGPSVQNQLLTLLEGQMVAVNMGSRIEPRMVMVDTTYIAFVALGAFSADEKKITSIVTDRQSQGNQLERAKAKEPEADDAESIDPYLQIKKEDLIAYGFNAQVLGRLSTIIRLRTLLKDDLRIILTDVQGCPMDRYRARYKKRGFDIEVEDAALDIIAERASQLGTGARGLEEVLTELFEEVSFELESRKGEANLIYISEMMAKMRGPIYEEGNEDNVPPTFQLQPSIELIEKEVTLEEEEAPSDDDADSDDADDAQDPDDPEND